MRRTLFIFYLELLSFEKKKQLQGFYLSKGEYFGSVDKEIQIPIIKKKEKKKCGLLILRM